MMLHCDVCDRELAEYLYGSGGVEEMAFIGGFTAAQQSIPNITCFECGSGIPQNQDPVIDLIKKDPETK